MRAGFAWKAGLPFVVVACTTFGVAPDDRGSDWNGEAGADGSLADGGPSPDAARAATFCERKPQNAVFCADFEPGGGGLEAFDSALRPSDVPLRTVVVDERKNSSLEVTGDAAAGPRIRKVLRPATGYRLRFRVQVRSTTSCEYMSFGGLFATYGDRVEGGHLYGAALYAPSLPFALSGGQHSSTGVVQNLQPGTRWYDILVEVGPLLTSNTRASVVRIDGTEAGDQTTGDRGDPSLTVLAVELGRIYTSKCGPVTLRFDDILVSPL